jgi:toxin HigB-1
VIRSFRNKALGELWRTGRTSKIDVKMQAQLQRRLDALDRVARPEDMAIPGFDFHGQRGFRPKRYTVHVNGPWCVTFAFQDGDAIDVDFEQYH